MEEPQANKELKTIQHLLKYASNFGVLTKTTEYVYINMVQTTFGPYSDPDFYAKQIERRKHGQRKLVDHNLRLVIKFARRYAGKGVPLQDLIQEGLDGLLYSIDKFEMERNFKLSTYAVRWICQRMGRSIENTALLVRVPTNRLAEVTTLKKFYATFIIENNHPPSPFQVAEGLGWPIRKVEELGRAVWPHESLDKKTGDDNNLPLIDYVLDDNPPPEILAEISLDKEYIREVLAKLTLEEQLFIDLKFGLTDGKERKHREVAQKLKISLKEAKAREEDILAKLTKSLNPEKLNHFYQ